VVDTDQTAGVLLITGALIFLAGAAVGVPTVFTVGDPQARLRLLEQHPGRWRAAQPLYGLGPLITVAGVGSLAAGAASQGTRATFWAACLALAIGALAWSRSLYLRGTRMSEFAFGTLPGWPFATYVLLTIAGLALLGIGILTGGFPVWLGWFTFGADIVFLIGYTRFKDIPPLVFYLLLIVVGAVLV
jgi:hypothetical protein